MTPASFLFMLLAPLRPQGIDSGIALEARDALGNHGCVRIGVRCLAETPRASFADGLVVAATTQIPILDIPWKGDGVGGEAGLCDLRPLLSPAQIDTYHLRCIAAPEAFPVVLTWDASAFRRYDSARLHGRFPSGRMNRSLKHTSSLTVRDGEHALFTIVLAGPGGGA